MFIIISSELTFFGNWRNRNPRMKPLKSSLKPLKIWISPINCFVKERCLNIVADIRLFKESSFFLFKFCYYDIHIFCIEKRTRSKSVTLDNTVERIISDWSIRPRVWLLIFTFVGRLFCIKVLVNYCLSSLDLNTLSFILWLLFVTHLLKFLYCLFELLERPVIKVIASFFCLEDVLLKLLRIIVFLNDLLEEVLLFIFLAIIHSDMINVRLYQLKALMLTFLSKSFLQFGHLLISLKQPRHIDWHPHEISNKWSSLLQFLQFFFKESSILSI